MRRSSAVVMGLAILGGAGWAASGQVQRVPGPGTGVVTVTGEVNVVNRPAVDAAQQGEWKVSVANTAPVTVTNTPSVTVALPIPLRRGVRYEIAWPTGEREVIVPAQAGATTWVRVERSATTGPRWVNVAAARAIAEVP